MTQTDDTQNVSEPQFQIGMRVKCNKRSQLPPLSATHYSGGLKESC